MVKRPDCLEPPLGDGSGYLIRMRDLRFLRIDEFGVTRWRSRTAPLGLSERQYKALRAELGRALFQDGIALERCDVRLKGSAAEFFSGHHKVLPRTRDDVIDEFRSLRKRLPAGWEVAEIEDRLSREWITDGDFPHRRPFDSMCRLGIDREPSDIDVQISCDEIVKRCQEELRALGQAPETARVIHEKYSFVRKDLVEAALPTLEVVRLRLTDSFGRGVTVAVFPSEGPPDVSDVHGLLSSHFRDEDWKMMTDDIATELGVV